MSSSLYSLQICFSVLQILFVQEILHQNPECIFLFYTSCLQHTFTFWISAIILHILIITISTIWLHAECNSCSCQFKSQQKQAYAKQVYKCRTYLNRYVPVSVFKMYLTFVPVAQWEHQLQCAIGSLYKFLKTTTERSETKCKVLPHALKLLQDLLPEQMLRRICICCVNTWRKCQKMLQRDVITMNLLLIEGVWF